MNWQGVDCHFYCFAIYAWGKNNTNSGIRWEKGGKGWKRWKRWEKVEKVVLGGNRWNYFRFFGPPNPPFHVYDDI